MKNKPVLYFLFLNTVLVIGLILFKDVLFKDIRPFVWTMVAVAFFFLYEIMVIFLTEKKRKTITPAQSINLFLGLKLGKIILSLFCISIYAFAVKIELKRYVLVFVLLYFIYLLFDTLFLTSRERKGDEL
jgi:hypothetical protein